ncbi:Uncharacterised protein [Vibrio cholerae]|nr:Uncharacterised protein [Vibrio cholerae]CSC76778.1 Uncharacterised protein [Vibrio cholerae]CSI72003.1 Uncharacterised protein [Vibrio cholerae]
MAAPPATGTGAPCVSRKANRATCKVSICQEKQTTARDMLVSSSWRAKRSASAASSSL